MRWTDSIKEAVGTSLQEVAGLLRVGCCGRHVVTGSLRRELALPWQRVTHTSIYKQFPGFLTEVNAESPSRS